MHLTQHKANYINVGNCQKSSCEYKANQHVTQPGSLLCGWWEKETQADEAQEELIG